jgi:hypothetical protein
VFFETTEIFIGITDVSLLPVIRRATISDILLDIEWIRFASLRIGRTNYILCANEVKNVAMSAQCECIIIVIYSAMVEVRISKLVVR